MVPKMNEIKSKKEKTRLSVPDTHGLPPPVVGRLAGSDDGGRLLVEFDDSGPRAARMISGLSRSELAASENIGRQVLLLFENNDPELPIVIGLIANPLEDLVSMEIEPQTLQNQPSIEARLDGKRIVLEADDEIELKCGKGSITIRKDGKIVVKGTNLLSRSSGPHRIKGGNVAIN